MRASVSLAAFLMMLCASVAASELPTMRAGPAGGTVIENQYLIYAITGDGRNERFVDRRTGRNYAVPNAPCAYVKRNGKDSPATAAMFTNGLVVLRFADSNVRAVIRIKVKNTYFLEEVVSLTGPEVEGFVFADVPLTLHGSPEEPFAAVALALNLQTLVPGIPQPGRISTLRASVVLVLPERRWHWLDAPRSSCVPCCRRW